MGDQGKVKKNVGVIKEETESFLRPPCVMGGP